MTTTVEISSAASGAPLSGALAEPRGATKVGGVVVVQEFWGLSEFIRRVCDRLAEEGWLALAPDLFHGKLPASKPEAAALMKALDRTTALAEIGDSVAQLRASARSNGRVAVVGFCMGGGLALDAARSLPLEAAVCFYGVPHAPAAAFTGTRVPVQAHFARRDEWATLPIAEAIRASVVAGGGSMEVFAYDAGHAFMRSTDPGAYDETQAHEGWARSVRFLKKQLASG